MKNEDQTFGRLFVRGQRTAHNENDRPAQNGSTGRREVLRQGLAGIAALPLATRLSASLMAGEAEHRTQPSSASNSIRQPHFPAKAKRVIFLFMLGGPSQFEMFDYKPKLIELDGHLISEDLLSKMKFAQIMEQRPSLLGTHVKFARYGESGAEVSELLPHTAKIADDLAIIKTMQTDEIPHHPAEVFLHTGTRMFGRPSMGAWVNYGLGSESPDLPGYVVLQSGMRPRTKGSIYASGFLSAAYQGVPLRDGAEPILNLASPSGFTLNDQRSVIEAVRRLNLVRQQATKDPETAARNQSYHLAERLGETASEAIDLGRETASTLAAYGADPTTPSFAKNCLLARRLIERGVRFVHLCHGDWDHHSHLQRGIANQCLQTDQACAALITDLKQRGLLEDTLVIWGGEFGRTAVGQRTPNADVGRDHQIAAYTMWLAGGGIRSCQTIGQTDELGCFPVTKPIHVHDLHATILHLLGLDHKRLTHRFQGRDFRLTDVAGNVVPELIA
jgi:uncharacterized protein (DUF1501 family)